MFDILWNGKPVGTAECKKEGLYYRFDCSCTPPDKAFYRVVLTDGQVQRDLGICVPQGNRFVLTARVPCKLINTEALSFELTDKRQESFSVPVNTGEPFEHLEKIETARLQVTNGQAELIIAEVQDPQDNDPNQESQHIWESL